MSRQQLGEGVREGALLVPTGENRHASIVELRGESLVLEARLRPTTTELNSNLLRINRQTWVKNLKSTEESAGFLIDYCRQLTGDDSFRPNSTAECRKVLGADK